MTQIPVGSSPGDFLVPLSWEGSNMGSADETLHHTAFACWFGSSFLVSEPAHQLKHVSEDTDVILTTIGYDTIPHPIPDYWIWYPTPHLPS